VAQPTQRPVDGDDGLLDVELFEAVVCSPGESGWSGRRLYPGPWDAGRVAKAILILKAEAEAGVIQS
jgi:hypothetical protein